MRFSIEKAKVEEKKQLAEDDEEAKVFVEKYKIKQSPNYALYLQKTDKIPKYIEDAKYLSKNLFEKVVLTSYPRSGNTLLRKYLEDITGIVTGSDCDVKRKLNSDLVEMGMRGEGKVCFSSQ